MPEQSDDKDDAMWSKIYMAIMAVMVAPFIITVILLAGLFGYLILRAVC